MIDKQEEKSKRGPSIPVDVIALQHQAIHRWLEDWGRWSREKRSRLKCGSAEGSYRARRPQGEIWEYEPPRATLPVIPNPQNLAVDRAVLRLPEQHRAAVKMFYVEGRPPRVMCRALHLHWAGFEAWMFACRAMVLNQLRKVSLAPSEETEYKSLDNSATAKARLLPALEAVASVEKT